MDLSTTTQPLQNAPVGMDWRGADSPISVLLLDDDDGLRKLIEQAFTIAGFRVMTARDGGEGLQILLSHRFDVVVSDLVMEPMDGITFLSEALRIWPWMRIVILSGYVQDEVREKARALGITTILEKPSSFHELTEGVRSEAERVRQQLAAGSRVSLNQIQYQLSILGETTRTAMEATSISNALGNLSRDLGEALPTIATAIMSCQAQDGNAIMIGTLRKPVSAGFIAQMEALIRTRYQRLTSLELGDQVRLQFINAQDIGDDGISEVKNAFSFPIIDHGTVTGLLVFVPPADYAYSESDISFLYHATNQLTTVLTAFHRIRELAVRDELTGLYNRHYLQDELVSIWQMAYRYGFSTSMMILDVDHFKQINDTYGHLVGDQVLSELGQIVHGVCRSSDLVARYGGDEIIIVMPDADPASLGKMSRRLTEAVRAYTFCARDGRSIQCTVSVGAASGRNRDGALVDADVLMTRTDEALYLAKRNGRDRSYVWTESGSFDGGGEPPLHVSSEDETTKPSILVIDDDRSVLKVTDMLLRMEGCETELYDNGTAAHEAIVNHPGRFDVALIDLNLNDMNGLELIQKVDAIDALLVKIVITGEATLDNAVNSLRHGAYDFIQKPIQLNQLRITLGRALEYHRLRVENLEYQQNLEVMVRRKSLELTNALQRTRDSLDFTLRALASMLEAREHATGAHSQRVQDITCMLARDFGFSEKKLADIRQGALLHDIGKIAIPDAILLKGASLSDEEWRIMRTHVTTGYELICKSPDLKDTAELMRCHHEAFDGSGYPSGLKGENIPLGARIFTLVDAYDAMRSDRPYRKGMARDEAVREIQCHRGGQFDPVVVDAFIKRIDDVEKIGNWIGDSSHA
ncbi:MAG TPA: hypothetical protein DCS43_01045 [Verrucomicrobia bacterium]|nr:hypothetical protein [Verrucomicrobiota bacterium]